jgi:F0F1-type ATP synthase membrane subunit c/vacuolar-type H+-ATPase subunit K
VSSGEGEPDWDGFEWQKAVMGTALAGLAIGLGLLGLGLGVALVIGRAIHLADQKEAEARDRDQVALLGVVAPLQRQGPPEA